MVDELDQSGQLLNTDRKLAVFRRFLTSLKEDRGWYDYDKQEQVCASDKRRRGNFCLIE
jgi:hypothetical protein